MAARPWQMCRDAALFPNYFGQTCYFTFNIMLHFVLFCLWPAFLHVMFSKRIFIHSYSYSFIHSFIHSLFWAQNAPKSTCWPDSTRTCL